VIVEILSVSLVGGRAFFRVTLARGRTSGFLEDADSHKPGARAEAMARIDASVDIMS
jgi:hypothetical protein